MIDISPVETSSAADEHEQPPTAVGVDPIDELPPSGGGDEDGVDEDHEFKSMKDYWDWLKGKLDDLWSDVTGSEGN